MALNDDEFGCYDHFAYLYKWLDLNRRKEALSKMMETSGYKEKVPLKLQEQNVDKCNQLTAELEAEEEVIRAYERLII